MQNDIHSPGVSVVCNVHGCCASAHVFNDDGLIALAQDKLSKRKQLSKDRIETLREYLPNEVTKLENQGDTEGAPQAQVVAELLKVAQREGVTSMAELGMEAEQQALCVKARQ